MNTDNVVTCLLNARDELRNAIAEADDAGIDIDFIDLINQIELRIYAVQAGQGDL